MHKIVMKPWGYEYIDHENGIASVCYLHMKKGYRTSDHFHVTKHAIIIPLTGTISINGEPLTGPAHIPPATVHHIAAITDAWIMEVETPVDKNDLVRLSDPYGRVGMPYESGYVEFDPSMAFPDHSDETL